MTTEVADDSELAWDEFVPDGDDTDADSGDPEERDGASAFDVEDEEEDLALAKEDLELRWDAFEANDLENGAEDEVAAADAARIAAALERMERRVMGIEDEPVDDDASVTAPAADETTTGDVAPPAVAEVVADGMGIGDHEVIDDADAGFASDHAANGEAAGEAGLADAELASLGGAALFTEIPQDDGRDGVPPVTAEDRMNIDAAFARMEEALFGDSDDDAGPVYDQYDEGGEPEGGWIAGEDSEVAGEELVIAGGDEDDEDDELSAEAYALTDEPDEWLENEEAVELVALDAIVAIDPDGATPGGWAEDAPTTDGSIDAAEPDDRPSVHTEFEGGAFWLDENAAEDEVDDRARDADLPPGAAGLDLAAWDDGSDESDETDAAASSGALVANDPPRHEPIVVSADLSELDEYADPYEYHDYDDYDDYDRYDEYDENEHGETTRTPAHVRARRSGSTGTDVRRLVLLACLFFAVVIGAVVLHFGHVRSDTSAPPATAATPGVVSPANTARLETAITDVQSASSGAQAGLSTLSMFPTPPRIATIINPYVDSLELYAALASTVAVPSSASAAAHAADVQVHQDITFLRTINGLPSVQLGSFLEEFFARSTQLQSTMDALQQALIPATP